jgi:hypothetical protein
MEKFQDLKDQGKNRIRSSFTCIKRSSAMSKKCKYIRTNGKRCKNPTNNQNGFCHIHQPAIAPNAKTSSASSNRASSRSAASAPQQANKTWWIGGAIAAILLVLSVCIGLTAFAATRLASQQSAAPAVEQPAAPAVQPTAGSNEAPNSASALGTGIPVPSGQHLINGNAYIIRDIVWSGNSAEVWVFATSNFNDSRGNATGPAWDGISTTHVRDAWTSSTGAPWQSMPLEVCKEAQAIVKGSLGTKNVVVHIPDGNGGWMAPPAVCPATTP